MRGQQFLQYMRILMATQLDKHPLICRLAKESFKQDLHCHNIHTPEGTKLSLNSRISSNAVPETFIMEGDNVAISWHVKMDIHKWVYKSDGGFG